jgi:hypothetical protein
MSRLAVDAARDTSLRVALSVTDQGAQQPCSYPSKYPDDQYGEFAGIYSKAFEGRLQEISEKLLWTSFVGLSYLLQW